ncbi:hypothetical protein HKX48_006174 [Thoreauomyces humboldtii]|nr:hypothetical protein HKX48_006174 [Thoreauomyces humboldtii]
MNPLQPRPPLQAAHTTGPSGNGNLNHDSGYSHDHDASVAPVTVTFGYSITRHSTTSASYAEVLPQIKAKVQALCDSVAAETGCSVWWATPEATLERTRSSREGPATVQLSLTVVGPSAAAGRARGTLLRNIPTQTMLTIKAPVPLLLAASGEMQPHVRKRLDAIMAATRTEITCFGQKDDRFSKSRALASSGYPPGPDQGDKGWESMDVEIVGRWEDAVMAKMDVLVFLDELAGLYIEPLLLAPNLHSVLAGRKRCILETVMHDTQTNIYLPTAFLAETCIPENTPQILAYSRTIWIAGSVQGVRQAAERLGFMAQQRASLLRTRSIPALPRKLDWLLLNRKEALLKIMSDNATHITIPPLGSGHNTVQIAGDDRVYLDRTCRVLMHMVCDFYVAGIQLESNPIPLGAKPSHPLLNLLSQIPLQTQSELLLSPPYIELYGLNPFVKSAFLALTSHPTILPMIRDTKFQLELALEHRDFINGKKNGKINKITKVSGCRVTFQEHFNEWNMFIDLYNATAGRCVEGLGMLEDELPAEISFYVPEAYHKRIIGVGGKNIQRIMKKWAVYVKFSNAEEFAQLGGYFENMDNVIARTPAKNSPSLDQAKENIMELTGVDLNPELTITMAIPRQMHRLVVGPRAVYLNDLTKNTAVEITLPQKDSGMDDIIIAGSEGGVNAARGRLSDLVPAVHFYTVPGGQPAYFAISSGDFTGLSLRLRQELGIDVYVHQAVSEGEFSAECTFMLYYHRHHTPPATLEAAKQMIADYLTSKGVVVQRTGTERSGSYANLQPQQSNYDSFQHFHSKLVVGVTSAAGERPDTRAFSTFYQELGGAVGIPRAPQGMTSSKYAQSTPNLRQLFEEGNSRSADLRRSQSGLPEDDSRGPLGTAAKSLGDDASPQWPMHFPRHLGSMSIDTSAPGVAENESDSPDPFKDSDLLQKFAGMLSPIDAPRMGDVHRTSSDQYYGMKMGSLDDRQSFGSGSRITSNLVPDASASDPPPTFTLDTIRTLFALEQAHPKDFEQTRLLLSSLDLDNYMGIFVDQEVDFPTLLLLGDADLRELGVRAFGTRKRILGAIRECKEWRAGQMASSPPHQHGGMVMDHMASSFAHRQQQQQQQQQHQHQHNQQQWPSTPAGYGRPRSQQSAHSNVSPEQQQQQQLQYHLHQQHQQQQQQGHLPHHPSNHHRSSFGEY